MKTKLTEMLGIEYPIVCGGMMRLCYPAICAAISNAGELGNLMAAMYQTKEDFRAAYTGSEGTDGQTVYRQRNPAAGYGRGA